MKSRAFLPAAGAAAAAVLLLTQAETAAQAVREGISLIDSGTGEVRLSPALRGSGSGAACVAA